MKYRFETDEENEAKALVHALDHWSALWDIYQHAFRMVDDPHITTSMDVFFHEILNMIPDSIHEIQ